MGVTPGTWRAAFFIVIVTCCAEGPRAQSPEQNAAARDQRLIAGRAQLATLLRDAGANGRIAERSRGNYLFSPSRSDLPDVAIRNTAAFGAFAVGPLLRVWGSLDDNGALTIIRYSLAVTAERP